jgi:hypothetical protein
MICRALNFSFDIQRKKRNLVKELICYAGVKVSVFKLLSFCKEVTIKKLPKK